MLIRNLGFWPHGIVFDDDPASGAVPPPPPVDQDKKFTQAELDKTIADRLNRQRAQHEKALSDLKAEYADYDELKDKAGKYDDLEAEKRSELERLQADRDTATQAATDAQTERDNAIAAANDRVRRADIIAAAAAAGADPDLTYAYLRDREFKVTAPPAEGEEQGSSYEVTVGDDGQVTGHEDAVKAVIAAKPGLVGETPEPGPGPSDGGARTPAPTPDLAAQIADAEAKGDWETSMRLKSEQFDNQQT